jgi:hypothetical protein
MLAGDTMHIGQTQTRATAKLFGREKGFEDALQCGMVHAAVGAGQRHANEQIRAHSSVSPG